MLYRYSEDENGELNLDNILIDEEYDAAAKAFYDAVSDMMEENEEAE